jgi:tRNA A-37 threonylcarbamoyl transferase component Bud32
MKNRFSELIKNPFFYRCGDAYRATNIVFPVEYHGENYIVKMNSTKAFLANLYYTAVDSLFFDTRKLSTGNRRLKTEAEKLRKLDGHCAPMLYAQGYGILVKEFLFGADYKHFNIARQRDSLEQIVHTVKEIHDRGVIIGDANVKNYMDGHWIDFDGVFKPLGGHDDKSLDLLKLIYSTYASASSEDNGKGEALTYLMALDIKKYYNNESVLNTLGFMMYPAKPLWRMWLATKIPRNGVLLKELRKMFLPKHLRKSF